MIRFDQVYKEYPGRKNALDNISAEIKDGEFLFLIGPSGAGKTTMLRMLLRDTMPTQGSVHVDDWQVNKLPKNKIHLLRRKIGMIFQDFKLLHDRTVFENVAIGLEIAGKKRHDINKDVSDILELVGLGDKRHLFPVQLSAGEMQRTSIARAIIGGPKILLADEPTGNLDPKTAWEILDILEEINKIGTTIIMATHNVSVVNDLKKRTITIKDGKIVSDEVKGKYHLTQHDKPADSKEKESGKAGKQQKK
jgi:cell division transport system ATP-binding protein